MRFGSAETFEYIASHIGNEGDVQAYERLADCIQKDTFQILKSHAARNDGYRFQLADMEEIAQEVQLRVFPRLVSFYFDPRSRTVGQRNSWLKTVILNTAHDFSETFIRKNHANEFRSLEELGPGEALHPDDSQAIWEEPSRQLFSALEKLCRMNSSPDRIMAFILNKIAASEIGKNGKPSEIADELNGKTLSYVFWKVQLELTAFLGYPVPDEVLAPLWNRIEPISDNIFSLSGRKITDSSNDLTSKMSRMRENDAGA